MTKVSRHSFFFTKIFRRPEVGVVASTVIIWILFYSLSPKFLGITNIGNIFIASAAVGIMAVGIAFLLISGEFDLSVGPVFMIVPWVMLSASTTLGLPLIAGFFIAMGVACLIGLCNAMITLKLKIPSFITTLGMMMLLAGILLSVTGGYVVYYYGHSLLVDVLAGPIGNIRVSVIWMIVIGIIFSIILEFTKYGNRVYATGGDITIAKAMGVNVNRVKITNFILCSLLAGFAGCLTFARVVSITPVAAIEPTLVAMAAAVIGGCLLSGGHGSIIGTLIGAVLLTSVSSGLILAGASPYLYRGFVGGVLLLAAIINASVTRRAKG